MVSGGDLSSMDNYRPIPKLCILSKIQENLVNKQLTVFIMIITSCLVKDTVLLQPPYFF